MFPPTCKAVALAIVGCALVSGSCALTLADTTKPLAHRSTRPPSNQSWDTIRVYWTAQAKAKTEASYPTLRLDAATCVGEVGVGDPKQSLSISAKRSDSEFLVLAGDLVDSDDAAVDLGRRGSVFLFRRFDFSGVAIGGPVPTPALSQITGTFEYFDEAAGLQRKVLIVEPLSKENLPLPSIKVAKAPANTLRPKPASAQAELASTPISRVKQASAMPLGEQPRFVVRSWVCLNEHRNLKGRLVGVGSDVIWVRVGGGKTLRVPLSSLNPADRNHALAKKQAILDYRARKAATQAAP